MAKKLSVEEILAAARAEKAKGGASSPAPAATAPAAESAAVEPAESTPAEASAASGPAKKVAPGGKGMSMAEILAAARAKTGAGAPAAKPAAPKPVAAKPAAEKAASKPAAAKPAAKEAATAVAAKDTASILAAARKGTKPGPMTKAEAATKAVAAPAAKKRIEVPPMPAKPDYARPKAVVGDDSTRRGFFAAAAGVLFGSSLAIGFTSLAVTHLMWLLGFARFMFPNILIEPPTRFKVGFPDGLSPGQVETKFIPQFGVWVVRYEFDGQPMIYAIKSVCTHLGCTPNWLEAEQKFKCPCHGSGFYKDGINFEGPAPRPLERYAISLAEDGQLLVDKSRTFQQELGQWKDPASYVMV
jgi:cytochrome b6-f complex iron-sulfur subunit